MKSKPVYSTLTLDETARRHLVFVQGAGSDAAARLSADSTGIQVVSCEGLSEEGHITAVVERTLEMAAMDTAFYIAGPERFLWFVARRLRSAGVEENRIRQELAGSRARRVYCVHCRTMNEPVTDTVHKCSGCGLLLTVRDHFSRPLGAYMGVIVNAEDRREIPEAETLYL